MRVNKMKTAVGIALVMALACGMGYAKLWGSHKTDSRAVNITVTSTQMLQNGPQLKAGNYKVEVPAGSTNPEVAFYQHGRAVARVKAELVNENQKNPATEVDSTRKGNEQYITEIRPGGWMQKLVFGSNGSSTHTSTQ